MQDQIRPVETPPFRPAWWLKNAHLQTVFAKYLSPNYQLNTTAELLSLPDTDEVQLNWLPADNASTEAPLVLLLHGLAGDINSHYIQAMLAQCQQLNWPAVLLHFRGCNGKPNKLPRAYHSGDTADTAHLINILRQRFPSRRLVAVGYSLGANVLLKYCGEQGADNPLAAAVAICPPIQLDDCAKKINSGSSKLYQHYLLTRLKRSTLSKLQQFANFPLPLTAEKVKALSSIEQFDEHYTAPVHGFENASDYYRKASAKPYLKAIAIPTLVIHANDDPFLSPSVIPKPNELSPQVQYELTEGGGHVGFVCGSLFKPRFWLNQRVPHFIAEQLAL